MNELRYTKYLYEDKEYIIVNVSSKLINSNSKLLSLNRFLVLFFNSKNIIYMSYINLAHKISYRSLIPNFFQSDIFQFLAENTNTSVSQNITINRETFSWFLPDNTFQAFYDTL